MDVGCFPESAQILLPTVDFYFLLSFLAAKEFRLDLEAVQSMRGEEGNNRGLKLPYGVSLFVSGENSCCLELFDLTETRIKTLFVSSFDITWMNLKNTIIEELFLVDEAALKFFYDSMERCEFYVEKVSFGNNLKKKSEKFLKLIERVHGGEITAPRKIKALVLNRNSFFCFLEEARRISQRKIHVEDLGIIQSGKDTGPGTETSTRIVVSQKIRIRGNARVLLFIELGPELSHLNIDEIQRQCRSPRIYIPKINIQLTESKIRVRENLHVLQFFKKNITAAEMDFFTTTGKKTLWSTKITLAVGEMESICFGRKGLSVLSRITNEKVDVRHMAVMDIMSFFEQEEARKKEFVIRERLYVRNTGILFLECLRNTVFIPAIEIEVDCCMEYWGGFGKTTGIHIETNALVGSISPGIEDLWGIKQTIREIVTQKKVVVKNEAGYPKLVFEEDSKHGEQNEAGESEEQPITGCQTFKDFIKEYFGRYEEQRETEDSREQPSVESKMFDEVFKELYSLLQRSLDMHNPEDSDCLQEEEVVNPFWNLFLEHRSQYLCRLGLHALR
ncbi:MAG: uncharacterized protein A8A55_2915 [Amphiamblys sp. WSBS2006]|nr:MAG: uncharacterized protein A8A55_2915 [Amphiamblys sp. WSBS2006]